MFFDDGKIIERIARNRAYAALAMRQNKNHAKESNHPEDWAMYRAYVSRHDAIVQTWAEVTDQTWQDALEQLQEVET